MCSEVGADDIVIFIQVCALVHVQAQIRRRLGLMTKGFRNVSETPQL